MASMHTSTLGEALRQIKAGGAAPKASEAKAAPQPKRGDSIFENVGGPRTWNEYVGQRRAKGQMRAAVASAKFRNAQVDHILIASGVPGVGKSALARIVAAEFGGGLVEVQGSLSQDEAQAILSGMKDGDFLFLDEVHQLVVGGKSRAEWLLPLMQDGVLLSAQGEWKAPKVTIIGASTNAAELPEAILSRFTVKPVVEMYSDEEATDIAQGMAQSVYGSIGLPLPSRVTAAALARAANNSPRDIKSMLRLLRDAEIAQEAPRCEQGHTDLSVMLEWAGRTADGLDDLAQRFLATLYVHFGGRAGKETIMSALGESTWPKLTENLLITKGYLGVDKGGRFLTDLGKAATLELDL